ncbi:MAG: cob(I)alamin adenosyltransferase [Patescibacteria group bacterium]|nr:cob(I)alamin adenosyltransferase [Patescibacteria group bacterium]
MYTRRGDNGTTGKFGTKERVSKASLFAEAIGTVDEVNSYVGLIKFKMYESKFELNGTKLGDIVEQIQQNLFIVQAELAGAEMHLTEKEVSECEAVIASIKEKLPPITSFFVPGSTELGALCDVARAISRRAERECVRAIDQKELVLNENTRQYLNRLSSILYALSRYVTWLSGKQEKAPRYNK